MDTPARLMSALAAVALAVTLSACAAQSPSGGAPRSGSSPSALPSAPVPVPAPGSGTPPSSGSAPVVRLASGFAPSKLRLAVGQSFLLVISTGVQASAPPSGNLLTERPVAAGRYLYTARAPGDTTLSTFVKPKCPPGAMCPQWIALARLTITIRPSAK